MYMKILARIYQFIKTIIKYIVIFSFNFDYNVKDNIVCQFMNYVLKHGSNDIKQLLMNKNKIDELHRNIHTVIFNKEFTNQINELSNEHIRHEINKKFQEIIEMNESCSMFKICSKKCKFNKEDSVEVKECPKYSNVLIEFIKQNFGGEVDNAKLSDIIHIEAKEGIPELQLHNADVENYNAINKYIDLMIKLDNNDGQFDYIKIYDSSYKLCNESIFNGLVKDSGGSAWNINLLSMMFQGKPINPDDVYLHRAGGMNTRIINMKKGNITWYMKFDRYIIKFNVYNFTYLKTYEYIKDVLIILITLVQFGILNLTTKVITNTFITY